MNKCLYVISFNEEIFEKTGNESVSSFLEGGRVEGDLFLGYEGNRGAYKVGHGELKSITTHRGQRVLFHSLDNDALLNKVLEENKDVIPTDYGGDNEEMSGHHGQAASGSSKAKYNELAYYRYRASKWWRVFATLEAATKLPDYDYIVQIDSDVAFVKPLPFDKIKREMEDYAILYHEGHHRKRKMRWCKSGCGVETSFTCYSKKSGGYEIIHKLMAKLTTGDFRKHRRWDDSYLLSYIIHNEVDEQGLKCKDLITDSIWDGGNVVERGAFKDYVRHFKGVHVGSATGKEKLRNYLAEKND